VGIGDRQENPEYGPTAEPFAKTVKEKFNCSKCEYTTANVRMLYVGADEMLKQIFSYKNRFVAVTCQRCGFTELYDV